MEGLVLRIDAKVCHVDVAGTTHILPLRGRLFEKCTNNEARPIAVGDRVMVTLADGGGAIDEVLPRTTRLARRKAGDDDKREQVIAANVTLVMVMASIRDPKFQPELVDRILAGAEREHIPAILTITKVDRDKHGVAEDWAEMYRDIGYDSFVTCVIKGKETHESLDMLRGLLHENVTVITGASGVGKSSLINTLTHAADSIAGWRTRSRHPGDPEFRAAEPRTARPGVLLSGHQGVRPQVCLPQLHAYSRT